MRYGVSVSSIGTVIGAMIGGESQGNSQKEDIATTLTLRVATSERENISI